MNYKIDVDRVFDLQKVNQFNIANTTSKERVKKLKLLRHALLHTYNQKIKDAVFQDLRKHEAEAELSEIVPVVGAINYAVKHLKKWMRESYVPTPITLFGFDHNIKYEPKGVVLIIAPWNFPINLALMPLVSAIASGNAIILKPSENTPASSSVLKEIISDLFSEDEIYTLEGGIPETTYLLEKPFNHIFFTGAPEIGKIVMKAASKNLTSVSLELGGKSPTIIDKSANLKKAAMRIAWSKSLNNGQVCIAPDYILIHESLENEFVKHYKSCLTKLYGTDISSSTSYGRIVNQKHFKRLVSYLDDATQQKGKVVIGGKHNATDNYIEPTVISNLPDEAKLWKEEIFGPILPIRTFTEVEETIQYINQGEKPLALYIYSKKKSNIEKITRQTRSGAVVINYSATHYVNPHLPFGGSNNSGIGKTNGIYGFQAFSNAKAIQRHQSWNLDILKLIYPPFTPAKIRIAKFISKYFA